MNGFAKGAATFFVSLSGLLAVVGIIGIGVTNYLDDNFGDGITAIIVAILFGVTITLLIVISVVFLLNQTHRAAGEDITEFAKGWAGVFKEKARENRELAVATVNHQYKLAEKQRQVEQAAAAEEAQWTWVLDDTDADAPVYYQ